MLKKRDLLITISLKDKDLCSLSSSGQETDDGKKATMGHKRLLEKPMYRYYALLSVTEGKFQQRNHFM